MLAQTDVVPAADLYLKWKKAAAAAAASVAVAGKGKKTFRAHPFY
jgi:hypothetical protein